MDLTYQGVINGYISSPDTIQMNTICIHEFVHTSIQFFQLPSWAPFQCDGGEMSQFEAGRWAGWSHCDKKTSSSVGKIFLRNSKFRKVVLLRNPSTIWTWTRILGRGLLYTHPYFWCLLIQAKSGHGNLLQGLIPSQVTEKGHGCGFIFDPLQNAKDLLPTLFQRKLGL